LFTLRDWERFGCAELATRGYDILCVQVWRALRPGHEVIPRGAFRAIEQAQSPATLAELEAIIAEFRPSDIILVAAGLSDETRPLFRLLGKYRVRYAGISLGNIPISSMRTMRSALSIREFVELRFKDLLGFGWQLRRLFREVTKRSFEYFLLQPPYIWLVAGTAMSVLETRLPSVWRARRIPVASFDYLSVMAQPDSPGDASETAVFIDEGFADHPDFAFLESQAPVNAERYWGALERLFKAVEEYTGLRVVVAPHPKSKLDTSLPGAHRWIEGGRTAAAVRDSSLVLCHVSTAVSFAVIYRKPILFLTTDEIERSIYGGFIACMSSRFGARRINADHFAAQEISKPTVDERAYALYEQEYLKAPEVGAVTLGALLVTEMSK
jgi:hypothetical protein